MTDNQSKTNNQSNVVSLAEWKAKQRAKPVRDEPLLFLLLGEAIEDKIKS